MPSLDPPGAAIDVPRAASVLYKALSFLHPSKSLGILLLHVHSSARSVCGRMTKYKRAA